MKPSSWDKQLGLASPLECAASQSGQTNNPSKECGGAGCKSPYPHLPEGRGEAFFLDILFHRMSDIEILRQQRGVKYIPAAGEPEPSSTARCFRVLLLRIHFRLDQHNYWHTISFGAGCFLTGRRLRFLFRRNREIL